MYQRGFAGIENLERMIDWNLKHKGKKEMDVGPVIPHFFISYAIATLRI